MKRLRKCNRRQFLKGLSTFATLSVAPRLSFAKAKTIRFGVTPAFLHDRHSVLEKWRLYLTQHIGQEVEFIRRDSYRETMDMIRLNQLDFAWICDYPYLRLQNIVKLLTVPLYRGRPAYRSYLVVKKTDNVTEGYLDLKGKVFAYADPYSNTGYLSPRYEIKKLGYQPRDFFKKTFFTRSHRKVIEAVAIGLADAGAVDSYIWDSLESVEPELTGKTRIVWQSEDHGFPPIVAHRKNVNETAFFKMQKVLLDMPSTLEGQEILTLLGLDGFSVQELSLYDSVAEMMRSFGEGTAR